MVFLIHDETWFFFAQNDATQRAKGEVINWLKEFIEKDTHNHTARTQTPQLNWH